MPEVTVGQVWRDNDKRLDYSRDLRVDRIENGFAYCSVFANGSETGKTTRISLQRFKPNSTGYRLVQEVDQ